MECPKCGYVRPAHDKSPEGKCPRCGAKFSPGMQRLAKGQFDHVVVTPPADRPSQAPAVMPPKWAGRLAECEDCGGKVSRAAVTCPHCGRPFGSGRTPVDVMNIKMEFEAMVWFMVKAALAAIPAGLILVAIWFAFLLLLRQFAR